MHDGYHQRFSPGDEDVLMNTGEVVQVYDRSDKLSRDAGWREKMKKRAGSPMLAQGYAKTRSLRHSGGNWRGGASPLRLLRDAPSMPTFAAPSVWKSGGNEVCDASEWSHVNGTWGNEN